MKRIGERVRAVDGRTGRKYVQTDWIKAFEQEKSLKRSTKGRS